MKVAPTYGIIIFVRFFLVSCHNVRFLFFSAAITNVYPLKSIKRATEKNAPTTINSLSYKTMYVCMICQNSQNSHYFSNIYPLFFSPHKSSPVCFLHLYFFCISINLCQSFFIDPDFIFDSTYRCRVTPTYLKANLQITFICSMILLMNRCNDLL